MCSMVYVPRSAITDEDIVSLLSVLTSNDKHRVDAHGGRQAVFKYLSSMRSAGIPLTSHISDKDFEKWAHKIQKSKNVDHYRPHFDESQSDVAEPYWELTLQSNRIHPIAKRAIELISRSEKFSLKQLKIYFNPTQIGNIPFSNATFESAGFHDEDAKINMTNYPLVHRHNKGEINTKQGRIEDVIFHIPANKQVIVLDFADERMPGGLFLYGATTQEETICYHSNTYGALLDFKYKHFDGGFMIPEFGCLYIKRAQFYKPEQHVESRPVDIIAGACYDLTREHGLYPAPETHEGIEANTRKKLETIVAAAQANSDENGNNTYLIIGPIGCGAFQNPINMITKLWAEILAKPLNADTKTQVRHAFDHVWFLSGKVDKLELFEHACANVFGHSVVQRA